MSAEQAVSRRAARVKRHVRGARRARHGKGPAEQSKVTPLFPCEGKDHKRRPSVSTALACVWFEYRPRRFEYVGRLGGNVGFNRFGDEVSMRDGEVRHQAEDDEQ